MNLHHRIEQARDRLAAGGPLSPEELAEVLDAMASAEREIDTLSRALDGMDERLLDIENSRFFRALRLPGRLWHNWRGRLGQLLLHSPLHPLYLRTARRPAADLSYTAWVAREQSAVPPCHWFAARARALAVRPRFSVLMAVYNPRREWLEAAIDSVRRQYYPGWELCVCDDGSASSWVGEYLKTAAQADSRIRWAAFPANRGISAAGNRAAELATGQYAAFLDQDDILPPYALHYAAEALQQGPADLLYSDEDRLDDSGSRIEPIFKPAWSPDLLLSCMYMGHLLVVRREAAARAGWLRSGLEGAQDYDLALRITEGGGVVRHIPRVLYHWRKHEGSTAARTAAKPYTHETGRRALEDAVERRAIRAVVADGTASNTYRLDREPAADTLASIVICSRQPHLAARCLRALARRTAYTPREVVLVHHLGGNDAAMERLLARNGCVRVPYAGPFDFAAMNNLGARHAHGEVLVFLNDDVSPLDPGWLAVLVAHAQRPDVGIAGARLLYPWGAIQHAGMAIGIMNGVGHPGRDTFGSGYWPWSALARDVSSVTGACLAVRRSVFEELGGFDPAFPVNYNDADFCLRAAEAGYRVIYEPAARLRHDECRTRRPGVRHRERECWQRRWDGRFTAGDPFYSPNLSPHGEQPRPADSPPKPEDNAR